MLEGLGAAISEALSRAAAVIMGSANPTASTTSRRRQGDHVPGDPAPRVRADAKETERSSVDMARRPQKNDITGDRERMRNYPAKVTEPKIASEDVVAEFQTALIMCESDLEEQRTKYKELVIANSKASAVNAEQAERIEDQTNTLAKQQEEAKWKFDLLNRILTDHLSPYAESKGALPKEWFPESILELIGAMSKDAANANTDAAENKFLTEHVRSLQTEILANVERVHIAPDEQLSREFRVIVALVKTLSRTIRILDNVNIAAVLGGGILLKDVSHRHWSARPKKKLLVEAWIWSILAQKVFRKPFTILGNQCEILSASWQSIYMEDHFEGWPKPTALSEIWRHTTMESMLEQVDRETITHGKKKDVPGKLDAQILALRIETFNTIGGCLSSVSSTVAEVQQVKNIVDKAFSFAIQMALQRVRLQVTWPKVGDKFNTDTMKLIPDPDGEDYEDGTVAFVVNPGLTKWGDAHGKNLDHRYDIIQSLVQCEVAHKQEAPEPKPIARDWANVVKHGPEVASQSKRESGKGGESQRRVGF